MTPENKDWCEEFFDDAFAEHHLVRNNQDEIESIVCFLKEKLSLSPGDTIFDQCCGVGSLSVPLAKRGYKTIGIDLIPSYIQKATNDAEESGVGENCHFYASNAYSYTTAEPCDAAINWWTSFGYTPDDAQNIKMLECVYSSLKPGAWFALDYMNTAHRLKEFGQQKESIQKISKDDATIIWRSVLNEQEKMIVKTWSYTGKDRKTITKQGGGAKLYTKNDLGRLLQLCGFKNISFYGSIAGEPLSDVSPRCIVVAQKGL